MYAALSDAGEPEQLYLLDLVAGTRTKLAGRDDVDIAYLLYGGRTGAPFGVVYDAAKPSIRYLDPKSEWAQLHAGLMQRFPGELVFFRDFSRDGRKVLFTISSDRHPGAYYVLDRDKGKIQLIAEVEPWIKPEQMAHVRSIEFNSRDGRKLFGFYTTKGDGPQPLIVMPHGGPHGVYDTWVFDPEAQFLASRGYAVLQVNFRGSGGRGYLFEKDGFREWGGRIQDDIADGVHWAIDSKLADAHKICTFGASFGGYAALMNAIRSPGMYQCAVGYVGVYDLTVMKDTGDITESKSGRRYLDLVLGTDTVVLKANSPTQQLDKIKIPILLAAGTDDKRVPMAQFKEMKNAFEKKEFPSKRWSLTAKATGSTSRKIAKPCLVGSKHFSRNTSALRCIEELLSWMRANANSMGQEQLDEAYGCVHCCTPLCTIAAWTDTNAY